MSRTSADRGEGAPAPSARSAAGRLPIVEERLVVDRERVETGRVRLSSKVVAEEVEVDERLVRENVRVERIPADRIEDSPPEVRQEADRLVVPVVEEVLVRRWRVLEEVHLIRETGEERVEERVTLRRNRVEVERES